METKGDLAKELLRLVREGKATASTTALAYGGSPKAIDENAFIKIGQPRPDRDAMIVRKHSSLISDRREECSPHQVAGFHRQAARDGDV